MAKNENEAKKIRERSDAERRVRQCARLANLMRTLHLISGRGRWDAKALAEELECSQRTVHRMLATLSMAGVPWYFDEKLRAYRVREGFRFPLVEQAVVEKLESCSTESDPVPIEQAAARLVEEGEAFAISLQHFLKTVKAMAAKADDC